MDTGPMVALLDRRDAHYQRTVEMMKQVRLPVWTCEGAVTEACHLTRREPRALEVLRGYVEARQVVDRFDFETMAPRALALMARYASVLMSYTDACLVPFNEAFEGVSVFTLDEDFRIYRRHGDRPIPLLAPFAP